jgi:SAM-dependent methyltransferase
MGDLSAPMPFEPHRFQTAAQHYLAGRPAYAARLIARVAEICGLGPTREGVLRTTDRVMDLGCGPGQLGRAFAPYVSEVVGIDPEPAMLALAREGSPANCSWHEGSSYDLGPALGRFRLVTMGRSFHWMDRVETLRRLDLMVEEGGAIALFHDRHPEVPENSWRAEFKAMIERWSEGDEQRARRRGPGWVPHISMLLESAFCRLEEVAVIERRVVSADTLVERAFSMSSTAPARVGERASVLEGEIRALAERFSGDGGVVEVVGTYALVAGR